MKTYTHFVQICNTDKQQQLLCRHQCCLYPIKLIVDTKFIIECQQVDYLSICPGQKEATNGGTVILIESVGKRSVTRMYNMHTLVCHEAGINYIDW